MNQVAEGVKSAPVVMELAGEYGVEMPISEQVDLVVSGQASARDAYQGLLGRRQRSEGETALMEA
jgi:glycerol-3-phosphate dehydrogenase (NAD(P)+)